MSAPIVILGSGLAGITVLRELRKLDQTTPVAVVTADDGAFYSKPSLSNALAAGKSANQLRLNSAEQLAAQLQAEFHAGTRVENILADAHELAANRGRIPYSKLVLAVGARPLRLPLQGDGAEAVLSVNNLDDYARFRLRLEGARRVAILGAGLIGCEFANDLAAVGIRATLFDRSQQPLGRLLPPMSARFFQERLEAVGVEYRFDSTLSRVDREGASLLLTDNRDRQAEADLVLSAVGLQPAVELAQGTGLSVNRGIVVDRHLATSSPDIYALGDCAEVQGLVLPFVLPIMQCARALAKTLVGEATPVSYPAMPVAVKTPACPTVVCPPPVGSGSEWQETVTANGVRAMFRNAEGEMLGFALLGGEVKERQTLAAQVPAWL